MCVCVCACVFQRQGTHGEMANGSLTCVSPGRLLFGSVGGVCLCSSALHIKAVNEFCLLHYLTLTLCLCVCVCVRVCVCIWTVVFCIH